MAKKGSTAGQKLRHAAYKAKGSVTKNALRKLERHLKKHPQDEQALAAKASGVGRTRKTPTNRCGWVSDSLRSVMHPTTVTRGASRVVAQVLALSMSVAKDASYKQKQKKARSK